MINNKRLTVPNTLAVDITAAASASNGITQTSNVQNNFGTSNFAIRFKGSVPDWTPAANVILHHKHDGTNGTILTLLTTGILRTTINATTYDSTVATGMTDGYVAVIDVDISRSSASAAGSVVYTLNGVILGASVAITAGTPVTVDNTSSLYVCGTSAVRSASQWFSHRLFNRAKTVAENKTMLISGAPSAVDVGGSQTNVFTGDSVNFEGGTTGSWAANTGNGVTSVAVNIVLPISGTYDLKVITNGLVNSGIALNLGSIVSGEKYRLVFDYKGATSNAWNIIFRNNANPSSGSIWATTRVGGTDWQPATAGQLVYEFTASLTTGSGRVHIVNSAVDTIQLDNFSFVNLGCTSELLGANARNDLLTVTDSSGNAQNATLPAAGATVVTARK